MAFYPENSYHDRLSPEDKFAPGWFPTLMARQPFLKLAKSSPANRLLVSLIQARGDWYALMSPEQTAYALGQMTAAQVLSPVEEVEDGGALLEYQVRLRECLDDFVVDELVRVLMSPGSEAYWKQVEAQVYACVIYDRVAACIDITPNAERLYLRWANDRIESITHARFRTEIPLSLTGLQEVLCERFDALLDVVRPRAMARLTGHF